MKKALGKAGALALGGSLLLMAAPSHASTLTIAVDDAEVDVRGYHGWVSATVTDGGAPVAGVPLVFQKYRDGQPRAEICRAVTGADGRATCKDDPRPVGYGMSPLEVDPTVGDQQVLVFVNGDFSTYGFGNAHLRLEPYCEPFC